MQVLLRWALSTLFFSKSLSFLQPLSFPSPSPSTIPSPLSGQWNTAGIEMILGKFDVSSSWASFIMLWWALHALFFSKSLSFSQPLSFPLPLSIKQSMKHGWYWNDFRQVWRFFILGKFDVS